MLGAEIEAKVYTLENVNVKPNELTILLGNLLDNCNEALEKDSGNKKLILVLSEKKNMLYIRVENTYNGKIIECDGIKSSKSNPSAHGRGLEHVKKIVGLNNGEMKIEYDDNMFKVTVILIGK